MMNKITKKLIITFGAIVFLFALTNSVSATYVTNYAYSTDPVGYEYQPTMPYYQQPVNYNPIYPQYYQQPQYPYQQPVVVTPTVAAKPSTSVVNNYYYQTAKTSTTSTTNTPTYIPNTNTSAIPANVTNAVPSNNLGASAYNATGNGITALSLRGSGSFMPSSVWQWIFVFLLILAIVVIARMFVHKPSPGDHAH